MKTIVLAALAVSLLHVSVVTCHAQDARAEVEKVAKQYDAALLKKDSTFLDKLFDEEGMFVDEQGNIFDKEKWRGELETVVFETGKSIDRKFRVVGPSVIETGVWEATGTREGKPFTFRNRYCDVWTKKDGRWVITFEQGTPIAEAATSDVPHQQAPAQTKEQPTPGAEQKNLAAWVGEWTYQGEVKATPLGPESNFAGSLTTRMILNGAFLEERYEDKKNDKGEFDTGMFITGYDPTTQGFLEYHFTMDGRVNHGPAMVDGTTRTVTATQTDSEGKTIRIKSLRTLSEDGTRHTSTWECSFDDGKTWMPFVKVSATRVGN